MATMGAIRGSGSGPIVMHNVLPPEWHFQEAFEINVDVRC